MRKNLQQARENKGLTQKQAADALGIPYNTYRAYEYGKASARPAGWDAMEDFFGVPQRTLREIFPTTPKPRLKLERCPTCGQTIKTKKDRSETVYQTNSLQSEPEKNV